MGSYTVSPGTKALSRADALSLLAELSEVQDRLDRLKEGLRRLVHDA